MNNWYTHLTHSEKKANNNAGTNNTQYIGQRDAVFVKAQGKQDDCESYQPSVEGVTQASSNQSSKSVVLTKKGSLSLEANECSKFASIAIKDGEDVIEEYKVRKNGHPYRELISQGVWEAKLDNYQSLTKN